MKKKSREPHGPVNFAWYAVFVFHEEYAAAQVNYLEQTIKQLKIIEMQ